MPHNTEINFFTACRAIGVNPHDFPVIVPRYIARRLTRGTIRDYRTFSKYFPIAEIGGVRGIPAQSLKVFFDSFEILSFPSHRFPQSKIIQIANKINSELNAGNLIFLSEKRKESSFLNRKAADFKLKQSKTGN
jgi:hypothetical protein